MDGTYGCFTLLAVHETSAKASVKAERPRLSLNIQSLNTSTRPRMVRSSSSDFHFMRSYSSLSPRALPPSRAQLHSPPLKLLEQRATSFGRRG